MKKYLFLYSFYLKRIILNRIGIIFLGIMMLLSIGISYYINENQKVEEYNIIFELEENLVNKEKFEVNNNIYFINKNIDKYKNNIFILKDDNNYKVEYEGNVNNLDIIGIEYIINTLENRNIEGINLEIAGHDLSSENLFNILTLIIYLLILVTGPQLLMLMIREKHNKTQSNLMIYTKSHWILLVKIGVALTYMLISLALFLLPIVITHTYFNIKLINFPDISHNYYLIIGIYLLIVVIISLLLYVISSMYIKTTDEVQIGNLPPTILVIILFLLSLAGIQNRIIDFIPISSILNISKNIFTTNTYKFDIIPYLVNILFLITLYFIIRFKLKKEKD